MHQARRNHLIVTLSILLTISACSSSVKKWEDRIEASNTRDLELLLDSIYNQDQRYRRQLEDVRTKYGYESKELENLWKIIEYTDSCNMAIVSIILDKKGWLGINDIGYRANSALFLVIQHASLDTQLKYLPMMRDAAEKGNAQKSSLAMLEDRVALARGEKQIYGSQIGRNPNTGEYYVLPLIDPDNVNSRRIKMGMSKLESYVEVYGIVWDVEAYKKQLPQLERELK
ncbi:DUF6624 domain-containing protein [Roseivirga sp. UBA838]|uniref:DUF6624 domain-containing protein n=1 Tax=Roseivirga sp. UBA838 TaxID=1947393 RepID=UPI00257E61DA|nr:DUF6624 domain-containing protein [Roseivirga sp. UBA838]|tara:strand:+ start:19465 stop:20151 length:687 start_codon:yes stop_codon:yes gene_type:complete